MIGAVTRGRVAMTQATERLQARSREQTESAENRADQRTSENQSMDRTDGTRLFFANGSQARFFMQI